MDDERRLRVLISAYACEPAAGSEEGIGWNIATAVATHHDVTVITRSNNRPAIEAFEGDLSSIAFVYYDRPLLLRLKRGSRGARLYYARWQSGISSLARRMHETKPFDVAHHVTWTSSGTSIGLRKLDTALVIGPLGGATAPRFGSLIEGRRPTYYIYEFVRSVNRSLARHRPSITKGIRAASIVLAQNDDTQRWLASIRPGPVRVLSYVRTSKTPAPPGIRPSSPAHLKLLFVGRLVEWKGLGTCIRALALIPNAEASLTVLGSGPAGRHFEQLADKLGMTQRVSFRGKVSHEQVLAEMDESDLLVFPSLHDEGGFVALEALSRGLRPVVLDIGGPQAFQSDGAVVVPALPRQTLADRLATAILSASEMEPLDPMAIIPKWAWPSLGAQLADIYRDARDVYTAS